MKKSIWSTVVLAPAVVFSVGCSNKKNAATVFNEKENLNKATCAEQTVKNRFIVQWENKRVSIVNATDAEDFKKNFLEKNLENIKSASFDHRVQILENFNAGQKSPRPYLTENLQSQDSSWGIDLIEAKSLWLQNIVGENITVAVVDSFVDITHPQLSSHIYTNKNELANGKDDDYNGYVDDLHGISLAGAGSAVKSQHGTHIAGIIAADPNVGLAMGVAPKATILPAQFLDDEGGGNLGDALLAIQYAVDQGAKIINASWGGSECNSTFRQALVELEKRNVLFVAAAGNDGRDLDSYSVSPASFNLSFQITVAAASVNDLMTSWSNRSFNLVHIAAPGESILSTVPDNKLAYFSGTSMAAPFVSGAAALLWSAYPQASVQQIRAALLDSAQTEQGREYKVTTRGRLNVRKAFELLKQRIN
ncbi:MAG: S8 family peptidase [Pseudobdellovibrionaceae bacterium]